MQKIVFIDISGELEDFADQVNINVKHAEVTYLRLKEKSTARLKERFISLRPKDFRSLNELLTYFNSIEKVNILFTDSLEVSFKTSLEGLKTSILFSYSPIHIVLGSNNFETPRTSYGFNIYYNNSEFAFVGKNCLLKSAKDLSTFLIKLSSDEVYKFRREAVNKTVNDFDKYVAALAELRRTIRNYKDQKVAAAGCRTVSENGDYITVTSDRTIDAISRAIKVDHNNLLVSYEEEKPALEIVLMHKIFVKNSKVKTIVFLAGEDEKLPTFEFAIPGTIRDTNREAKTSFNIEGRGRVIMLNKDKKII